MSKFSKQYHLRHGYEFRFGFEHGRRFASPYLILFVWRNHLSHPRLGFALSKRCVALATRRNRIKRIIRESFRTRCQLPIDVIMVGRAPIAEMKNTELRQHLDKNWEKIERWYQQL